MDGREPPDIVQDRGSAFANQTSSPQIEKSGSTDLHAQNQRPTSTEKPQKLVLDKDSSQVSQRDEADTSVQRAHTIEAINNASPDGAEAIHGDNIRAHFDQVRDQYSVSKDQRAKKSSRFKGGKMLYRSIERPLNIYTRPLQVVDVTDPAYKRETRLLRKFQKMYIRQQAADQGTLLHQKFQFKAAYPSPRAKDKYEGDQGGHNVVYVHSSPMAAAGM